MQIEWQLESLPENQNDQKSTNQDQNLGKSLLGIKGATFNAISSLIAAFGGGSLGKEAPSVFISTSIFFSIGKKLKTKFANINLKNWIFVGVMVGFAIAFRAPIASLAYPFERFIKNKPNLANDNIFWTIILLIIALVLIWLKEGIFSWQNGLIIFNKKLLIFFLLAVLCGIFSAILKETSYFFHKKIIAIKSNFWHLIPIFIGLLAWVISLYYDRFSFNGGIAYGSEILKQDLNFSYQEVIARIIDSSLSFIAGCAGGLVAPAIAIGAGFGSIFANFAPNIDNDVFVLAGMAAFLSPILKTPITTAIVIIEAYSQSSSLFVFMIFVSIIASFTSSVFCGIFLNIAKSKFVKKLNF